MVFSLEANRSGKTHLQRQLLPDWMPTPGSLV